MSPCTTLIPLVVLIFPLVVLVYPPVVLVYPLAVSVCPHVVLVWPFVCPLVVLVVLSVGLFITDPETIQNHPQPTKSIRNHPETTKDYLHQRYPHLSIAQQATKSYLIFLLLTLNIIS